MATNHEIFLIHGMGTPTDDTYKSWEKALAKAYSTYSKNGETLSSKYKFHHIFYNNIFDKLRSQWFDSIDQIYVTATAQNITLPDKTSLQAFTDDNLFGTHIMDVLLYRFIPTVAQQARATVIKEFEKILTTHPGTRFSVLAYSLGSAVAHDAIHAMFDTSTGSGSQLNRNNFNFHTIAMIANVSRLLQTDTKAYTSLVRPEKPGRTWNYACQNMLSASHKFDPLAAPRRFEPDSGWPDVETRSAGRFHLALPDLISHWNTHAMEHYIADPQVHIPLFRYLRFSRWISKSKEAEVTAAFAKKNPHNKVKDYANKLSKMIGGEKDFSWKTYVEISTDFYLLLKEFTQKP